MWLRICSLPWRRYLHLMRSRHFPEKRFVRLLVSAGLIAAAAFATYWVDQRHIANLPFSRFALSSFLFPAALVAYAVATALQARRHRGRWVFLAVFGFALLIVTGTRSTLILALAPIVVVFAARRERAARFGRLALVGPVALVLMLAAAYGVLTVTHASHTVIGNRLTILKHSGTSSDASYADRQAQAHVAGKVFSAHPVFGAGPGTYFNWGTTNGEQRSAFIIDTRSIFLQSMASSASGWSPFFSWPTVHFSSPRSGSAIRDLRRSRSRRISA